MKTRYQIRVIGRVKKLRLAKQVTQKNLADILGMSTGHIGNIESEKFANKYTLPQLQTIANHFGVKLETLFMNYNEDSITTEECLSRVCEYIG